MDTQTFESVTAVPEFALGLTFEQIPEETVDFAALLLLDTLGVAAAATPTEAGRIARQAAVELYGAGPGAASARIMFDGRAVSPAGAAFAAATQIDNLDAHDGCNPTKGHLGVALIPALMAFAETRAPLSGQEALATLVMAYEVGVRAALALHGTVSDYHTSGAWNALAVAAIGSRLRGQSADQLRDAFGIAEFHGPRSQMMREIDAPSMLHDGSGWGALAGASAALMVEHGFAASKAATVEAPEVQGFWRDLGSRWYTSEHYIKPYPICRWAHAAIDGALKLRGAHDISADQIDAIEIRTFPEAAAFEVAMPATTSRAQYNLAFPAAMALVRGRVGVGEIAGDALTDATAARLVAATTVEESETYSELFPEGRWSDITVCLKDGRRLNSGAINARGGPEAPLTRAEIIDKYRVYAIPVLGQERAEELERAVLDLARPDASFGPVLDAVLAPQIAGG